MTQFDTNDKWEDFRRDKSNIDMLMSLDIESVDKVINSTADTDVLQESMRRGQRNYQEIDVRPEEEEDRRGLQSFSSLSRTNFMARGLIALSEQMQLRGLAEAPVFGVGVDLANVRRFDPERKTFTNQVNVDDYFSNNEKFIASLDGGQQVITNYIDGQYDGVDNFGELLVAMSHDLSGMQARQMLANPDFFNNRVAQTVAPLADPSLFAGGAAVRGVVGGLRGAASGARLGRAASSLDDLPLSQRLIATAKIGGDFRKLRIANTRVNPKTVGNFLKEEVKQGAAITVWENIARSIAPVEGEEAGPPSPSDLAFSLAVNGAADMLIGGSLGAVGRLITRRQPKLQVVDNLGFSYDSARANPSEFFDMHANNLKKQKKLSTDTPASKGKDGDFKTYAQANVRQTIEEENLDVSSSAEDSVVRLMDEANQDVLLTPEQTTDAQVDEIFRQADDTSIDDQFQEEIDRLVADINSAEDRASFEARIERYKQRKRTLNTIRSVREQFRQDGADQETTDNMLSRLLKSHLGITSQPDDVRESVATDFFISQRKRQMPDDISPDDLRIDRDSDPAQPLLRKMTGKTAGDQPVTPLSRVSAFLQTAARFNVSRHPFVSAQSNTLFDSASLHPRIATSGTPLPQGLRNNLEVVMSQVRSRKDRTLQEVANARKEVQKNVAITDDEFDELLSRFSIGHTPSTQTDTSVFVNNRMQQINGSRPFNATTAQPLNRAAQAINNSLPTFNTNTLDGNAMRQMLRNRSSARASLSRDATTKQDIVELVYDLRDISVRPERGIRQTSDIVDEMGLMDGDTFDHKLQQGDYARLANELIDNFNGKPLNANDLMLNLISNFPRDPLSGPNILNFRTTAEKKMNDVSRLMTKTTAVENQFEFGNLIERTTGETGLFSRLEQRYAELVREASTNPSDFNPNRIDKLLNDYIDEIARVSKARTSELTSKGIETAQADVDRFAAFQKRQFGLTPPPPPTALQTTAQSILDFTRIRLLGGTGLTIAQDFTNNLGRAIGSKVYQKPTTRKIARDLIRTYDNASEKQQNHMVKLLEAHSEVSLTGAAAQTDAVTGDLHPLRDTRFERGTNKVTNAIFNLSASKHVDSGLRKWATTHTLGDMTDPEIGTIHLLRRAFDARQAGETLTSVFNRLSRTESKYSTSRSIMQDVLSRLDETQIRNIDDAIQRGDYGFWADTNISDPDKNSINFVMDDTLRFSERSEEQGNISDDAIQFGRVVDQLVETRFMTLPRNYDRPMSAMQEDASPFTRLMTQFIGAQFAATRAQHIAHGNDALAMRFFNGSIAIGSASLLFFLQDRVRGGDRSVEDVFGEDASFETRAQFLSEAVAWSGVGSILGDKFLPPITAAVLKPEGTSARREGMFAMNMPAESLLLDTLNGVSGTIDLLKRGESPSESEISDMRDLMTLGITDTLLFDGMNMFLNDPFLPSDFEPGDVRRRGQELFDSLFPDRQDAKREGTYLERVFGFDLEDE